MKLKILLKKASTENLHHINLCDAYPQLVFEEMKGTKAKFTATYYPKSQSIHLRGALHNQVEINEFFGFLEFFSKEEQTPAEAKASKPGLCLCGVNDWELVSRADRFDAPLCGEMFFILKCKSCGRHEKLNVGIKWDEELWANIQKDCLPNCYVK
jgi:hypothetical protein